jgi:hypothetical protein
MLAMVFPVPLSGLSATKGCGQDVEFANDFQKHSGLQRCAGKPLIDHALPRA